MFRGKSVRKTAKGVLYLLVFLSLALLLYYGTWKMASNGSASNNHDIGKECSHLNVLRESNVFFVEQISLLTAAPGFCNMKS